MAESKKRASSGRQMRKSDLLKWVLVIFLAFMGMWAPALLLLLVWTLLAGRKRNRAAAAAQAEAADTGAEQETPAGGKKEKKSHSFWWAKRVLLGGCSICWDFFLPAPLQAMGGGVRFCMDQRREVAKHRAEKYREAMGDDAAVPLDELAKRMNISRDKLERDLERLIEKKYLTDLYIDRETECFLYRGARVSDIRQAKPAAGSEAARCQEILRKIRSAGDRIASEALSAKIGRLEQITEKIFQAIAAHPEKGESLHTFFDCYLPTTLKLLDAYGEFESAGVEGENLRQAKGRIEAAMDNIVEGFARQLDGLYRRDAMDVASDIQAMEAMLRQDAGVGSAGFPSEPHL